MSYSASFYLICRRAGNRYHSLAVRLASRNPALRPGEVPVYLTLTLPEQLFQKPQLRATISVGETQVPPAQVIAEVVGNIEEQLRKALGVEVKLTVEAPEAE